MGTVDLKERRDLYAPPRGRFVEVVVPRMTFLAVDGRGDPDTSDDYRHAVQALFTVSYAAKALSRRELGRDHVVMPLEGLWSATDWSAFERDARQDWSWTMMIRQPEWITDAVLERAREGVRDKHLPALPLLRPLALAEGLCVQTLHVGSYDDEAPVLRALHREHLPEHGLRPTGPHHEIYLSDPRRTAPARLRTVLRQPVAREPAAPDEGRPLSEDGASVAQVTVDEPAAPADQPGATPAAPPEVVALAEQRAAARAAKDFAESDRLRDVIADAGWVVRDGPEGYALAERPPYPVLPSVADLPDRSGEPDEPGATVAVLVEGWPQDVRTCVEALVEHAPPGTRVLLLENGATDAGATVHQLAERHDLVSELHLERAAGWSAARQALLATDTSAVHVLLDPSTVLEGDALGPVLAAFDDPGVVGAGWRGVRVQDGWTAFEDAGPGEVEALLGYLFAVRRSAAAAVPLPPQARFYRNADMEWSFLLREGGGRLVVPAGDLPVRQDRHRGYHDTPADYRDKESKKTYDRFLQRFRGRDDLRLPHP